ncbi:MAG: hypothetical protein R8K47_05775 [Mariprofundaceae bacterium]
MKGWPGFGLAGMVLLAGCVGTQKAEMPDAWQAEPATRVAKEEGVDCSRLNGTYRNVPEEAPENAHRPYRGEPPVNPFLLSRLFVWRAAGGKRPFDHGWVDAVRMRVDEKRIHLSFLEKGGELYATTQPLGGEGGFVCEHGSLVKRATAPGPMYMFTLGTIRWRNLRLMRGGDGALIATNADTVAGVSLLPFREDRVEHFRYRRIEGEQ